MRSAFSLTELLVAMAIGLIVITVAFTSFQVVQRYVNRIQRLEAANQVLQAAVHWHIHRGLGSFPNELKGPPLPAKVGSSVPRLGPAEEAIVRQAPKRIMVGDITGTTVSVYDYSEDARAAFERGPAPAISGWESTPGNADPRIIAQVTLPVLP